uniref:VWFA domain-containing protein n=1 Tax=Esox lucius TaxID=8010 RepID=A0A3P8ZLN9_ESOLU
TTVQIGMRCLRTFRSLPPLCGSSEREIEKFRVAVSVPPGSHISFSLSYEELLPRRLGHYELTLGLRPGRLVPNLTLDVSIVERTGLRFVKVLPLKTGRLLSSTVSGNTQHVKTAPSLEQQGSVSPKGLHADYIIRYDVELSDPIGDVQVFDGHFVHYFAPRGLPVVPKEVIFVIDVSGSMIGTKIKQTKQAMTTILGDLREGDHFNIITFSDKVHTWKKGRSARATPNNVRDAKEFVNRIIANGWTNINAALLSAAQLVSPSPSSPGPNRVPLVFFLTDGEATVGITAGESILSNARSALGSVSLFGLAFGDDADFPLLKRLALENRGVARMVYEDADAALQLKGFYDEVASPLLSDIQLTYLDDQAFDVSRSLFPNYFQGSELVVTGKVKPGVKDLKVSLTATGYKQKVKMENHMSISKGEDNKTVSGTDCPGGPDGISSFVHRLWAYFTIKELLLAKLNSTDSTMQKLLGEKATILSLKYNFVTPVTSLVVVKPDEDEIRPTASTTTTAPPTTTTTATPATTKTTMAHSPSTKTASPIPVKKAVSTPLPNSFKTASAPAPGKTNPHFVVQLPKLKQNLCFTVDGKANDVLRLLKDPERGITVDGHLISAPSKRDVQDRHRTYFDQIIISSAEGGTAWPASITISISLDVVVVEGEGQDTLPTGQWGSVTRQGVRVSMENSDDFHQSCWIQLADDICFLVLFHHYKHPSYLQMAHLGFYITDGQGLSPSTKGLLGTFPLRTSSFTTDPETGLWRNNIYVTIDTELRPSEDGVLSRGVLRWGVTHVTVILQNKTLKDNVRKRHLGRCWVVPKAEVEMLLGLPYQSYVVDHL